MSRRAVSVSDNTPAVSTVRTGWGEGSSYITIEKTRDGEDRTVYWFVVDVGHDADGVRKRAYGRSLSSFTEAHARASENAWKRSRRINQPRTATKRSAGNTRRLADTDSTSGLSQMTVSEYFRRWLSEGDKVSPATKQRHESFFTTHVEHLIGSVAVADVTDTDVEALSTELATKTKPGSEEPLLSVGAVRNIIAPVRRMFRYAVEVDEVIAVSPFVSVPTGVDSQ